ncbi:hypothetical protein CAEBREN_06225 [Caenorhabditis brenneri]|uniref:Uncharacterized protein n=1 Tax=Caenorhabditis brenneri TaxID=135651 RepID=G0MBD7_CAEBE|nr:hypothetical protein CAEBREN_06225 [Caenorhabditis brenneri]
MTRESEDRTPSPVTNSRLTAIHLPRTPRAEKAILNRSGSAIQKNSTSASSMDQTKYFGDVGMNPCDVAGNARRLMDLDRRTKEDKAVAEKPRNLIFKSRRTSNAKEEKDQKKGEQERSYARIGDRTCGANRTDNNTAMFRKSPQI